MNYITNKQSLSEALDVLNKKSIVALDTETTGLDPLTDKVLLIALGDETHQYVIDVAKLGNNISDLITYLDNPEITKVLHNAKFDYKMLKNHFYVDMQNMKDTFLLDCLITQGILNARHGLDTLLHNYLNIDLSKTQQTTFTKLKYGDEFTDEQIEYAKNDIKYLLPLYEYLLREIKKRNMGLLADLENECVRATGDLELNGIHLDRAKWLELCTSAEKDALGYKDILDEHFKKYCALNLFDEVDINYKSPKQVLPILSSICKAPISSTSTTALKAFKSHPAVKALLDYRMAMKRVNTYGEEFYEKSVHPIDGRIHAEFWQLGRAHTGRYASSKPNMQNIPATKVYREAFTAQNADYKIIAADFSGQELRLLAHISQEPKFKSALESGKDLHTNSASLVFETDYNKVSKTQRQAAKAITFGLIYGMGPMKLAHTLDIDIMEAKTLIQKYFRAFPQIKITMSKLEGQARLSKMALSPLDGRQSSLAFVNWNDRREVSHALNIAKNIPFQGAGASTTKLALCRIKRKLDKGGYDARLINVVHDEILVEVVSHEAQTVAKIIEVEMVAAFNYYAPSVAMEAEAHIGDCWIH
jgi:DNA polymerase I-like protein with 3'-5' exonuclease and polymerase domains